MSTKRDSLHRGDDLDTLAEGMEEAMSTKKAQHTWYAKPTAGHEKHGQSVVIDEVTGGTIAIVYDGKAHASLIAAAPRHARSSGSGPSAVE